MPERSHPYSCPSYLLQVDNTWSYASSFGCSHSPKIPDTDFVKKKNRKNRLPITHTTEKHSWLGLSQQWLQECVHVCVCNKSFKQLHDGHRGNRLSHSLTLTNRVRSGCQGLLTPPWGSPTDASVCGYSNLTAWHFMLTLPDSKSLTHPGEQKWVRCRYTLT